MDQIWKTTWQGGRPRFEAAIFRGAWICQRTPACYRLNLPFYPGMTWARCCSGRFLSTEMLLTIFWPFSPMLVRVCTYFKQTVALHICIACTQMREERPRTKWILQCEHYKIIKLSEESSFTARLGGGESNFRPWPMHQLDFYCSFPEVGCALSLHPVSCQHSATGVVSGESEGGAVTQSRWTITCISPAPSCLIWVASSPSKSNALSLGLSRCEYPVTSGRWKDVNILLMFRLLICSLTHHIMADGRFPKEWNSSSESHWFTEAGQVNRKIERTRERQRKKGRRNATLW